MLYCNEKFPIKERKFDWGTLIYVSAGEEGRGRKELRLPIPKGIEIKQGMNHLTIGQTKSGLPRINTYSDDGMFALLSSEGGYTRRGDGFFKMEEEELQNISILAKGNGADGAAGRIGDWDVVLLELHAPCQILNQRSGAGRSNIEIIIYDGETIDRVDACDYMQYCELKQIKPITMRDDEENNGYNFGGTIRDTFKTKHLKLIN